MERSCAGSLQEQKSLVIEKRGTPQAVLMSIRDYVRLAARSRKCSLGEESVRKGSRPCGSRTGRPTSSQSPMIQAFAPLGPRSPIGKRRSSMLGEFILQLSLEPFLPETKCVAMKAFLDTFPTDPSNQAPARSFQRSVQKPCEAESGCAGGLANGKKRSSHCETHGRLTSAEADSGSSF